MASKKNNNKPSRLGSSKHLPDAGITYKYFTPEMVLEFIKKEYPLVHDRLKQGTPQGELGILLLTWRLTSGRSQKKVSELAGCSLSSYQLMEEAQPDSNPGLNMICKVAKTYGVESVKEFWSGPGPRTLTT